MKKLTICLSVIATLIGMPALAADMAVKASPLAPAPAPWSWTGFYVGGQFGGGWSNEAVAYSVNDPASAQLVIGSGTPTSFPGEQPVATFRIPQNGPVGGIGAGYNWQAGPNWLVGLEADFSFAGMDGRGSGTSVFTTLGGGATQTVTAQQSTDWYG